MKFKTLLFTTTLFSFFLISCSSSGEGKGEGTDSTKTDSNATAGMGDYIDPVEVSPDVYQLLSEEGNIRVIQMEMGPGQKDKLHSHNDESVYLISGGKGKVQVGEEVQELEIPDGGVMHHDAWQHQVENIGETTINAILFERMSEIEITAAADYVDPIEVAPENYTLLMASESGDRRIVEMILEPGQRDVEHSHHKESVYFVTGGTCKVYVGGEEMEMEIPDGHVMHHDAWTHSVENVGETTIHAIIYEQMPNK